jgi:hypothetical protein
MRLLPTLAGFLDQYVFGYDHAALLAAAAVPVFRPWGRATTRTRITAHTGITARTRPNARRSQNTS